MKVIKRIKNCWNKYLLKYFKIIKKFIKQYNYIIYMALPFILMDIATRCFGIKINFFGIYELVPNTFTLTWIFLFLGIVLSCKKIVSKYLYLFFTFLFFIFFLVNNVYYSMTESFFDFNLLAMTSEGSSYMLDAIKSCNGWVYFVCIIVIILIIFGYMRIPKKKTTNYKCLLGVFFIFSLCHLVIPLMLGKANSELSWNTWRNPRNIYISFNDNNKSMQISGLFEYTFRNFYLTFVKEKKADNIEELEFLNSVYTEEETSTYYTNWTGQFKDKNLVIIQLEGLDSWLLTKEDTPTLYNLMSNSINFTNHYSYYNGGGSTFNSEFAVNTGFFTPLSYTQNAYTFNKNNFNYSLANLFKEENYVVNAFHMNTSEYYSRKINYINWGYDNYFGLKDLNYYTDDSYTLDRELILNPTFNENLFPTDTKFVDYIIAYSSHMPFNTSKGVCKLLMQEELELDPTLELTEEQCARIQAGETDYMVSLLIDNLTEKGILENTVIVVFTDHYLYTLSDQTILDTYKETSNNLINETPFFIWSSDIKKTSIKEVTSQLNILPTLLNLFGLDYNPLYYIGEDALNSNYDGYVFFSDYSWYDGKVYVDGGIVTNGAYIDEIELEEKNYYINYIIRKNDLTLKYNYFKYLN